MEYRFSRAIRATRRWESGPRLSYLANSHTVGPLGHPRWTRRHGRVHGRSLLTGVIGVPLYTDLRVGALRVLRQTDFDDRESFWKGIVGYSPGIEFGWALWVIVSTSCRSTLKWPLTLWSVTNPLTRCVQKLFLADLAPAYIHGEIRGRRKYQLRGYLPLGV